MTPQTPDRRLLRAAARSEAFLAASRAALMERLVGSRPIGSDAEYKTRSQSAFLVGILYLVHVLLGVDRR